MINLNLQQTRQEPFIYPSQKSKITQPENCVLIADCNIENRQNLKEMLDLYNLTVLEAENGEDVIEMTLQLRPDLILMDVELPKLNGYQTARVIRNIKSLDAVPIIFLSQETGRSFRKTALAAGGNSFHISPLDLERLDHILEHFLFRFN